MSNKVSSPELIKKLEKKWGTHYHKYHFLKKVKIGDAQPLRGVKSSEIAFNFPVSVICGLNGAGKTTFMSLATLAFHSSSPPQVPLKNVNYFDFNYFFKSTNNDFFPRGIEITWEYTNTQTISIKKGDSRWMRYIKNDGVPRRPLKGVEFIGISRVLPAFEKKNYSNYFSNIKSRKIKNSIHSEEFSKDLGFALSKKINTISNFEFTNSIGSHSISEYEGKYTSFNSGVGQECLLSILKALHLAPRDSFITIEEIEIGLHPSVFKNLINIILRIAEEKNLQILISSHSSEFLRLFPSIGLIYAERKDSEVKFINAPNVEYCINRLGGKNITKIGIICEDNVAAKIVRSLISSRTKILCPIICYASESEIIRKSEIILQANIFTKIIALWDGDVSFDITKANSDQKIIKLKLPTNLSPEEYIIEKIQTSDGIDFLTNKYGLNAHEINQLIEEIKSIPDTHDLFHSLENHLEVTHDEAITLFCGFVADSFKTEFSQIILDIENAVTQCYD